MSFNFYPRKEQTKTKFKLEKCDWLVNHPMLESDLDTTLGNPITRITFLFITQDIHEDILSGLNNITNWNFKLRGLPCRSQGAFIIGSLF